MQEIWQFVTLNADVFGSFVSPSSREHYHLADPPDLYRPYSISTNTLSSSGVLLYLGIPYEISVLLPANF